MDKKQLNNICIYIDHNNKVIKEEVFELISVAKYLKEFFNNCKIIGVLAGNNVKELVQTIVRYDIEEIWYIDKPYLNTYIEDSLIKAITFLIEKIKPEIFIGMGTLTVKNIFPQIAIQLKTGLTADCTDLKIDQNKRLIQIRPAFGGNIIAEIITPNSKPQMATIKPGIFQKETSVIGYDRKIIDLSFQFETRSQIQLIDILYKKNEINELSKADIIVAVGKGIKSPENLPLIISFADALNASIGASRAIIEAGWLEYQYQIGLSGRTVKPKIYIACGISGAIQHLVGLNNPDIIIGINSDPNAPIFEICDYCIIGDILEVIPEFLKNVNCSFAVR